MRVSPQKRAANRRNALKSTGPKTSAGRRASAQNATRHGLSVPLPPPLAGPVQQQLVQLIMSDGFDHDVAHNLAGKIIEYERNILYLQEIYHKDIVQANDPSSERGAAILEQEERQAGLIDILTDIERQECEVKKQGLEFEQLGLEIEQLDLEVINPEKLQKQNQKLLRALHQTKSAGKRMLKSKKNLEVNRIANSQRYFKRASNQLIKALKRL